MNKNVIITLCIVFILVVGIFFFFSNSSCKRESPSSNVYSFTHLSLTIPPDTTEYDWQELEKVYRTRIHDFADMRIFQVDKTGREAIVEITGAPDPDLMASFLITPLKIVINSPNNDEQIAESIEIDEVRSIYFDEEMTKLGLYLALNSEAGTRLSTLTSTATPETPITLTMYVDGKVLSEASVPFHIVDNTLQFEMPENFDGYTTDLLSFMLSEELPFMVGVIVERSYFIPPKGSNPTALQFKDVIGDLLKK